MVDDKWDEIVLRCKERAAQVIQSHQSHEGVLSDQESSSSMSGWEQDGLPGFQLAHPFQYNRYTVYTIILIFVMSIMKYSHIMYA